MVDGWGHGVVFVNGVNLGRFTVLGPGRTLYVPTGVLHSGINDVVVFESDRIDVDLPTHPGLSGRVMETTGFGPLWHQ